MARTSRARRALSQIRAATRSWPLATSILYDVRPPNRPLTIYRGSFILARGTFERQVRGTIELTWFPHIAVAFRGRVLRGSDVHLDEIGDDWMLTIPGERAVEASVRGVTLGTPGTVSGSVRSALRLGGAEPVRAMRLHVANFHKYLGSPVRYASGGGGHVRLAMNGEHWTVQLDQMRNPDQLRNLLETHGGYAIGHVGMLTRRDGRRFTSADARGILTCLHYFLSFARGFWCGPLVMEGMRARKPIWTEWMSHPHATDYQGVWSWFPQDAEEAASVFAGFHDLWNRPSWKQALPAIIYWYVEANLNAGAIEGSLVLAHATLERLSWVHFVGHKRVDGGYFDARGAACRIAVLLADLGIPVELPHTLAPDLAAWASGEKNATRGPGAVTKVRDTVVHPPASERMAPASAEVRIQARQLALWYVELVLLALCRYNGRYVNRLHKGPTSFDATMPVPWAPASGPQGTP